MQAIVDSYKHANRTIQSLCKKISESLLISIDSKRIYENVEFEVEQQKYRYFSINFAVKIHIVNFDFHDQKSISSYTIIIFRYNCKSH